MHDDDDNDDDLHEELLVRLIKFASLIHTTDHPSASFEYRRLLQSSFLCPDAENYQVGLRDSEEGNVPGRPQAFQKHHRKVRPGLQEEPSRNHRTSLMMLYKNKFEVLVAITEIISKKT